MEGVVDLSFEAFNDLDNLPSAAGRGWLAADLSENDWTVPLGPGACEELHTMLAAIKTQPLPTLLRRPDQFEIPELTMAYMAARTILSLIHI